MKFCPECGYKLSGTKFCPECGANLAQFINPSVKEKKAVKEKPLDLNDFDKLLEETQQAEKKVTKQKEKTSQNKKFAPFEIEEHSDGTYSILKLKEKTALNITVPEGTVSIGKEAFMNSEVIAVSLPDGLLQIGDRAFKGCGNLLEINLPSSLVIVGEEAFADCSEFNQELPKSVKRVGKDALINTKIDNARKKKEEAQKKLIEKQEAEQKKKEEALKPKPKVEAPKKVQEKPKEVAQVVKQPEVKTNKYAALIKETMKNLIVESVPGRPGKLRVLGWKKPMKELAFNDDVIEIGIKAFRRKISIKKVILNDTLETIEEGAFALCRNLTEIVIPDSVTTIKKKVFDSCINLKSVVLPAGLKKIAPWTFQYCSNLTSIIIPNTVSAIGSRAFYCCKLGRIMIPEKCKIGTEIVNYGCNIIRQK